MLCYEVACFKSSEIPMSASMQSPTLRLASGVDLHLRCPEHTGHMRPFLGRCIHSSVHDVLAVVRCRAPLRRICRGWRCLSQHWRHRLRDAGGAVTHIQPFRRLPPWVSNLGQRFLGWWCPWLSFLRQEQRDVLGVWPSRFPAYASGIAHWFISAINSAIGGRQRPRPAPMQPSRS